MDIEPHGMIEVSKETFERHLKAFPRCKRTGFANADEYHHIWIGKKQTIGMVTFKPKKYYLKNG